MYTVNKELCMPRERFWHLMPKSANFLWKDREYFRLCKPYSLCPNCATGLCYRSSQAAIDGVEMNRHGCIPIKLFFTKQTADWIWPVTLSLLILSNFASQALGSIRITWKLLSAISRVFQKIWGAAWELGWRWMNDFTWKGGSDMELDQHLRGA